MTSIAAPPAEQARMSLNSLVWSYHEFTMNIESYRGSVMAVLDDLSSGRALPIDVRDAINAQFDALEAESSAILDLMRDTINAASR